MRQVYFNSAAGAYPVAPGVLEAMTACMLDLPQISGSDSVDCADEQYLCRQNLSRLINVRPEQIALMHSATHSLNVAILGLGLKPGDLVITSVVEHNSVLGPLARLREQLHIEVEYVPLDSKLQMDSGVYDKLLLRKPKLVVFSHAGNVTGRINPIATWFEKAKTAGAYTILDASQTIGRIPVYPYELFADMTAFPGYKGLRGPLGTGILHVMPDIKLDPIFVGGSDLIGDSQLYPEDMPMRLEAGTPNIPAIAGLNAAVVYNINNALGIAAAEYDMTKELYKGLSAMKHIKIFDSDAEGKLPIASFAVEGMEAELAGFALSEGFGVKCHAGLHCAPLIHEYIGSPPDGTVRFSASFANSTEDVDYAIYAVERLAA